MNIDQRLKEIEDYSLEGIHSIFGDKRVSIPKDLHEWTVKTIEEQQRRIEQLESLLEMNQGFLKAQDKILEYYRNK